VTTDYPSPSEVPWRLVVDTRNALEATGLLPSDDGLNLPRVRVALGLVVDRAAPSVDDLPDDVPED
jgi:hypothetical protein